MKTKCPACKCSLEINIAPCGSCMNINHIKLEKALCKDEEIVNIPEPSCKHTEPHHSMEEPKPVIQTDNNCNPKESQNCGDVDCFDCNPPKPESSYETSFIPTAKPLPPIEKLVYTVDGDDLERIQIVLNAAIDRLNINTC